MNRLSNKKILFPIVNDLSGKSRHQNLQKLWIKFSMFQIIIQNKFSEPQKDFIFKLWMTLVVNFNTQIILNMKIEIFYDSNEN